MRQELGPNQRKWIAALLSGDYEQTVECLRDQDGFCCLGVAADIFMDDPWKTYNNGETYFVEENERMRDVSLPDSVVYKLGLYGPEGQRKNNDADRSCSSLNDHQRLSFGEIALRLQSEAHLYFKEPR